MLPLLFWRRVSRRRLSSSRPRPHHRPRPRPRPRPRCYLLRPRPHPCLPHRSLRASSNLVAPLRGAAQRRNVICRRSSRSTSHCADGGDDDDDDDDDGDGDANAPMPPAPAPAPGPAARADEAVAAAVRRALSRRAPRSGAAGGGRPLHPHRSLQTSKMPWHSSRSCALPLAKPPNPPLLLLLLPTATEASGGGGWWWWWWWWWW